MEAADNLAAPEVPATDCCADVSWTQEEQEQDVVWGGGDANALNALQRTTAGGSTHRTPGVPARSLATHSSTTTSGSRRHSKGSGSSKSKAARNASSASRRQTSRPNRLMSTLDNTSASDP